jgi:developmental checkpoint coupling sporulation initiation to replication initiation
MPEQTFPHLVHSDSEERYKIASAEMMAARRLSDKASLLRPLKDEHLLEVYREAKKMNLSNEFIELLEEALSTRQLENYNEA